MRVSLQRLLVASLFLTGVAVGAPALAQTDGPEGARVDDPVLAELNFARQNPQAYAQRLIDEPVSAWERALGADPESDGDTGAYAEAIAFLEQQDPLPPLAADDRLAEAARDHVSAQGADGAVGHDSPGGERFDERLARHGVAFRVAAENIAYGPRNPRDVVRELIIDRGVRDRGHRRNIFLASVQQAGVGCGKHRDYGEMCVIDFAGRPETRALPPARLLPPILGRFVEVRAMALPSLAPTTMLAEQTAPQRTAGHWFTRLFG